MINNNLFKRVYVWSGALRIYHWAFALSIITLILTGLYIHEPWMTSLLGEYKPSYVMLTMRYLHFVAAYFFIAAILIRFYLFFFGNKYEKPTDYLPINSKNLRLLKEDIKFKLYLTDHCEEKLGHVILAGITYFLVFIAGLVMIISGLYMLYPEVSVFKKLGHLFFGTQQTARNIHYLLFYFFSLFVIIHLYILVWTELRTHESIISSIFSGYKFAKVDKKED